MNRTVCTAATLLRSDRCAHEPQQQLDLDGVAGAHLDGDPIEQKAQEPSELECREWSDDASSQAAPATVTTA